MKKINNQRGVGMVEVLISLIILAIGVLGYVALQLRAVDASSEALNRAQAITMMRSLTESIRANIKAQDTYPEKVREYTNYSASTTAPTSCFNTPCTSVQLATFDAYQAAKAAFGLGMKLAMTNCPGTSSAVIKRQCLFAAWGNTNLTVSGSGATSTLDYSNCMSSNGVYNSLSTCMMMEAY